MYFYWRTIKDDYTAFWTVGVQLMNGSKVTDSDHLTREDARARVSYLNGGLNDQVIASFQKKIERLEQDVRQLKLNSHQKAS